MVNKKATLRESHELGMYLWCLNQDQNLSIRPLSRKYPQIPPPTICRHGAKKIEEWT